MNVRSPAVKFIFITLLLDVLGFGLIIPVAPRLVKSLLHDGAGGSEGEAAHIVGYLTALYAVMQLVFSPVLGALSDRFGRRPVLLVSIFGSGVDYIAMALAPNLWFLFITRAINGISGASMSVCSAYIADVTSPADRAKAFGVVGAAFGLGFVLGPAIGGLLGGIDIHLPFLAAAVLAFANWLYGYLVLPESLPPERRSAFSLANSHTLRAVTNLGRYPLVAGLAGSLFMLNLAMFGLHATWVLYTAHRYNWNAFQVGLSLTLVGLGAAIVQGVLSRKLIPALGERKSILIGMCIGVLAYIGYGWANEGWQIYVIIAIASLGGIAQPAAQAMITKEVLPTEQGAVQGALHALQSLANILGPIIGTQIFAYAVSGHAPPPLNHPGLSFFSCGLLAAVGTAFAFAATSRYSPRDIRDHVPEAVPTDADAQR